MCVVIALVVVIYTGKHSSVFVRLKWSNATSLRNGRRVHVRLTKKVRL